MVRLFRSQRSLLLENLALRQQLSFLKRRHPRPRLGGFDRLFWVVARRVWSAWKQSCVATGNQAILGADEILAKGRSGGPRRQAGNIVTFGRKLPLKNQTGVSVGPRLNASVVNSTVWSIIPGHFAPRCWCVTFDEVRSAFKDTLQGAMEIGDLVFLSNALNPQPRTR